MKTIKITKKWSKTAFFCQNICLSAKKVVPLCDFSRYYEGKCTYSNEKNKF